MRRMKNQPSDSIKAALGDLSPVQHYIAGNVSSFIKGRYELLTTARDAPACVQQLAEEYATDSGLVI